MNNTNANCTTSGSFTQRLENLPAEILALKRFVATRPEKPKAPVSNKWGEPENQYYYHELSLPVGFIAASEHDRERVFYDFDHVLDPTTGEWKSEKAKELFEYLYRAGIFCELSQSHEGLHLFAQMSNGKFQPFVGRIHFDDGEDMKLEIFYGSNRNCFVTGELYKCNKGEKIISGDIADEQFAYLRDLALKDKAERDAKKKQKKTTTVPAQPTNTPVEPSLELQELKARINAITPDELEAKGYLQHSENGDPRPDGYICPWCGSGTHEHKSGALTYYEKPELHFTCHSHGCGGDVIAFLAAYWSIEQQGREFIELLKRVADDFGIPYDPKIFEYKPSRKTTPPKTGLTEEQKQFLYSGDLSDDDFARRIVYAYGKNLRYLQSEDEWLIFKRNELGGGVWKNGGEKNSVLYPFATDLATKLIENARDEKEADIGKKLKATKKKATAITAIKGIKRVIISADDLNTHDNLFNCLNGVVDLETGKLYEGTPQLLLLTQQANVIYRPEYHDLTIEKFLRDILPNDETRAALIRFLGYAATGECSEERALFFSGDGGNGKGTLTKTLLLLYGDYGTALKTSAVLLMGRAQDAGAATTELNPLENCRIAIVEELPQGGRLDVAKFKNITGQDLIPIRKLHQEQTNIEPHFSPILSGNYLPELSDTRDPGLRRRLLNIHFGQSFTNENRDPHLKKKLATPDALSGFFTLILQGAIEWYKHGLIISEEMKRATQQYLDENDFISEFISEHCDFGENLSIPRTNFLNRLKGEYATECLKQFDGRDRAICAAIERINGITYKRTHGQRKFHGIGWKDEPEQQELFIPPEY